MIIVVSFIENVVGGATTTVRIGCVNIMILIYVNMHSAYLPQLEDIPVDRHHGVSMQQLNGTVQKSNQPYHNMDIMATVRPRLMVEVAKQSVRVHMGGRRASNLLV